MVQTFPTICENSMNFAFLAQNVAMWHCSLCSRSSIKHSKGGRLPSIFKERIRTFLLQGKPSFDAETLLCALTEASLSSFLFFHNSSPLWEPWPGGAERGFSSYQHPKTKGFFSLWVSILIPQPWRPFSPLSI